MDISKKNKNVSYKDAFLKAAAYCAYQERSRQEVREKLSGYELSEDETEEIIESLVRENYINDARFARAFAGGKFRLKKWGRIKIRQELKMRGISEQHIREGLQEIDDEAYTQTLRELLQKKNHLERATSVLERKQKLLRYALSKGYEQDIVWDEINGLIH